MKVTVLIENTRLPARPDLEAEHGLSLHIARDGGAILFDAGATAAFSRNAERLGLNLAAVERVVLSHHHYDHAGGLARFLSINRGAPVHLRRSPVSDLRARMFPFPARYIGLDQAVLRANPERFNFVDAQTEIAAGVCILTGVGDAFPRPAGNRFLFMREGRTFVPDRFEHELIMVVRESDGLVVFTGCSHRGILNLLDAVEESFPGRALKAVFGGFHLIGARKRPGSALNRPELLDLAVRLLERPVGRYYTGHCTGEAAYRVLEQAMGGRLALITTGASVEV